MTRDFTKPQRYTVVSSDLLVTNVYTITATTGFNFDDNTLQGWNNRVWDTNANSNAGGWVDLAPNATTMPATINEGVLQPPSANNQLFGISYRAVYPVGGNNDNHENTMWLRSPEFYLNKSGDLTLKLAKNTTRTAVNPTKEADIPMAAALNTGWVGVILRRVKDNAFVIVKPKTTAAGDAYYTTTFTQAELAQLSGLEAYTLEVINADRGSWGWLTMDNVSIPGSHEPAFTPGTVLILR